MILSDFRTLLPRFRSTQEETIAWITQAHLLSNSGLSKFVSRYVCKPKDVAFRHHALEDFTHTNWEKMRIFNLSAQPSGGNMLERMNFFSEVASATVRRFYAEDNDPPDELIHVTCTGYVSPSAAQSLVSEKNWGVVTKVTHAYHMGCYAAIPAVKIAQATKKRIDIVHTELCSLHFNPSSKDVEQLVVQGLFADGFIRYSAFTQDEFSKLGKSGLEVLTTREEIVPNTSESMTWKVSTDSMLMTLSRDVSKQIGNHLPDFLNRLLQNFSFSPKEALFAIHPGGPKIIEDVSRCLSLDPNQVKWSKKILREHGNMSSATIPHIWKEIVEDSEVPNGMPVISLAFGPGLTIAGALLQKRA